MKAIFNIIHIMLVAIILLPAVAFAGTATVRWQADTELDLDGYRIYHGTASRSYGPPINVGNVTNYTIDNLEEGKTHYFTVTALDLSGNESGYSQEVSKIIVDTQNPDLAITTPTTESNYITSDLVIDLAGNASDNVGVVEIAWKNSLGGSGVGSGTNPWSITNIVLAEGENVIVVTAVDSAGNEGSASLFITFTPPDTTASASPKKGRGPVKNDVGTFHKTRGKGSGRR